MADRVSYVGHATTLIEIDGVRLLTDPVLGRRVMHLRRRGEPVPGDVADGIDAVLISHGHGDHLDPSSLRRLGRDQRIVVPLGLGSFLRRRGFRRVEEIAEGEAIDIGGLVVRATPAVHDGRRWPVGQGRSALGYLIEGSSKAYFAGDTDLFDGMSEIGGGLDLALLPVAGWGPKVGEGHLDPDRAARAAALLRPRIAVPIHWGTLHVATRAGSDPGRPPREFQGLAGESAPATDVRVLEPGEATGF